MTLVGQLARGSTRLLVCHVSVMLRIWPPSLASAGVASTTTGELCLGASRFLSPINS